MKNLIIFEIALLVISLVVFLFVIIDLKRFILDHFGSFDPYFQQLLSKNYDNFASPNYKSKYILTTARISDTDITELKENQIFVFGSNELGLHNGGASKLAYDKFGAEYGKGFGIYGKTYALPTCGNIGKEIFTFPLMEIEKQIESFLQCTTENLQFDFLVTEIGCGIAGYTPKHIAPYFARAVEMPNVYLPLRFIHILIKENIIEDKI